MIGAKVGGERRNRIEAARAALIYHCNAASSE
jgi:hypothetical protein